MVAESRMMTAYEYELLPETDARTEPIDGKLIVSASLYLYTNCTWLQRDVGDEADSGNSSNGLRPLGSGFPINVYGAVYVFRHRSIT